MDLKEFRDILSSITYKPGFEIKVEFARSYEEACRLTLKLTTLDATKLPVRKAKPSNNRMVGLFSANYEEPLSYTELVEFPQVSLVVRTVSLTRRQLEDFQNKRQVLNFLLCEVIEMERHEAYEFFRSEGICVQSPHEGVPSINGSH